MDKNVFVVKIKRTMKGRRWLEITVINVRTVMRGVIVQKVDICGIATKKPIFKAIFQCI